MCAKVGVDPLASNKGFWAELLGIGDFYYELGWYPTSLKSGNKLVERFLLLLLDIVLSDSDTYLVSLPRFLSLLNYILGVVFLGYTGSLCFFTSNWIQCMHLDRCTDC